MISIKDKSENPMNSPSNPPQLAKNSVVPNLSYLVEAKKEEDLNAISKRAKRALKE